jgi:hypothetical protein
VPAWDIPSLAGKLFLRSRLSLASPPGITAMTPQSDFIESLGHPPRFRSWGGIYDRAAAAREAAGPRYGFEFASGAFHGNANDLIVAVASALGAGTAQPALACNHFEYFDEPAIHQALKDLAESQP